MLRFCLVNSLLKVRVKTSLFQNYILDDTLDKDTPDDENDFNENNDDDNDNHHDAGNNDDNNHGDQTTICQTIHFNRA